MKTTVNFYDFERAFVKADRKTQFSYEGLKSLFEWFEEYEEDTGESIELDVIAICCDFCEYDSIESFRNDYGEEYESFEDIEYRTIVIPVKVGYSSEGCEIESFIVQQF